MKRTPRMQKAILQSSILNTLVLIIFLCVLIIFALPKILYFGEKKSELSSLQNTFSLLQKKGISFVDFKTEFRSRKDKDTYIDTILKNVDSNFYTKNLQNTTESDFSEFITKVQKTVEDEKNSDFYKKRQASTNNILPVYGSLDTQGLRERDFINKIERTFRAFNLSAKGEIGIGDIKEYNEDKNTKSSQKNTSSLEESIFYIPLSFDIVGKKKDIFDFIHYFEKVGSVGISDNVLSVYNDERIRNPLALNTLKSGENIYEDQIAEIDSFEANAYPDSSTFSSNSDTKTLLEIVSLNQAKERYEISIVINFYVSGLPEYSMREYINSVIAKYNRLKKESQTALQKTKRDAKSLSSGKQIQALNSLVSLGGLFVSIEKSFTAFQKEFKKGADVRKSFKDAQVLEGQLGLIEGKLGSALEDLK